MKNCKWLKRTLAVGLALGMLLSGCLLYTSEDEESLARLLRFFPLLSPPLGVYACLGNNDRELPGFARAVSPHARLLVNESVFLEGLRLGGVDERKHGHPRPEAVFPHDGASARVLLAHYPVVCDFGAGARPDLQLSGHTHGGQFNMLGISRCV